jgi:hypothetical protein
MTTIIDGIEYLPASTAAQKLATTETKVLMLLKQKALEGQRIDGSWFVTTSSLTLYEVAALEPENLAQCRTSCGGEGCGCH